MRDRGWVTLTVGAEYFLVRALRCDRSGRTIIDAPFDAILRPSGANLLQDVAGRPERWTCRTGHIGLFLLLPLERRRIADWIEEAGRIKIG